MQILAQVRYGEKANRWTLPLRSQVVYILVEQFSYACGRGHPLRRFEGLVEAQDEPSSRVHRPGSGQYFCSSRQCQVRKSRPKMPQSAEKPDFDARGIAAKPIWNNANNTATLEHLLCILKLFSQLEGFILGSVPLCLGRLCLRKRRHLPADRKKVIDSVSPKKRPEKVDRRDMVMDQYDSFASFSRTLEKFPTLYLHDLVESMLRPIGECTKPPIAYRTGKDVVRHKIVNIERRSQARIGKESANQFATPRKQHVVHPLLAKQKQQHRYFGAVHRRTESQPGNEKMRILEGFL